MRYRLVLIAVPDWPSVDRHADVQKDDGTRCFAKKNPPRLYSTVPLQSIQSVYEKHTAANRPIVCLGTGIDQVKQKRLFKRVVSPGAVESLNMANDLIYFADAIAKLYTRCSQWALPWDAMCSDSLTIDIKQTALTPVRVAIL